MFTGIIEERGKVATVGKDGAVLEVAASALAHLPLGSSVAVNGACLTVVESTDQGARFDVVAETLTRTNLGGLGVGDEVNLERAMPADGRFDGHIVQGHIDGTGSVVSLDKGEDGVVLTISAPMTLMRHIAEKGSITIDGVSLTVAAVNGATFSVALIPHTMELTTLGSLSPGATVNLETDVIAKYLDRMIGQST